MAYDFRKLQDAQERCGQGPVLKDAGIVWTEIETLPGARAVVLTVAGDTDAVDEVIEALLQKYPMSMYGTRVEEDGVLNGKRIVRIWRAVQS